MLDSPVLWSLHDRESRGMFGENSLAGGRAGGDCNAWSRCLDGLEGGGGSGDGLLACLLVLSCDTFLVGTLDVSVADITLKANGPLAGTTAESG
jgi:hypothetical protein